MSEIAHVTEVKVLADHRLGLAFDDGSAGELDFSGGVWRGVFEPLAEADYFGKVELDRELRTIVWPNGADIAPETLHEWVLAGAERVPA